METSSQKRTKVLVISEALGTPSDPGSMRDYATAWLEQIGELGADITLLVERPFGLDGLAAAGRPPRRRLDPTEVHAIAAYLSTGSFRPRLTYGTALGRVLVRFAPSILRLLGGFRRNRLRPAELSRPLPVNALSSSTTSVLGLVHRIVLARRFYSSARLRAAQGAGSPIVDCTGYDLALIEGLYPVSVVGIRHQRIVSLIGGVASLRSPLVGVSEQDFRLEGLLSVARRHGTLVFPFEAERTEYARMAGASQAGLRLTVPLVSHRIQSVASIPKSPGAIFTMPDEVTDEYRKRDRLRRLDASKVLTSFLNGEPAPRWNPHLPLIVCIAERDAREEQVAQVAERLEGAANIILLLADPPSLPVDRANFVVLRAQGDAARLHLIAMARAVLFSHRLAPISSILEALALGTPVVCVDGAPCRELCCDAAMYVPSNAAPDLARGCKELLGSPSRFGAEAQARRMALASNRGEEAARLAILGIMRNASIATTGPG